MKRLGIGVIGCGNIAATYMRNASMFRDVALVACADLLPEAADRRAGEYGVRALSIEQLLADPEVDLVLNLTVPSAHFDVTMSALSAGKHVFTEKPLATSLDAGRRLVGEAALRGLSLGSAPDTFLGAAGRQARAQMEAGTIGRVVTGSAFMMGRGMEHWHPNPQFYYQPGGGPLFDMGPYYLTMLVSLLGPVARVLAMATTGQEERLITADGPHKNTTFRVGTPTTLLSLLEFVCGAAIVFGTSWDVFRHSHAPIEMHGTEGSLSLPDPDTFGGTVSVSERGAEWRHYPSETDLFGIRNWPFDAPDRANYRMLGVADLARGLASGRPARTSAQLALHVLDIMESVLAAAQTGERVVLSTSVKQPLPLDDLEARSLLADPTPTRGPGTRLRVV